MKINLDDVTNIDSITTINSNFDMIVNELQDKVLYRENPVGEPNTIENDLDMNGFDIINVNDVYSAAGRWATIDEMLSLNAQALTSKNQSLQYSLDSLQYSQNSMSSAYESLTAFNLVQDQYRELQRFFLGGSFSEPVADNQGNSLQTGCMYLRLTEPTLMRVFNGSAWQDVGSITTTTTNTVDPVLFASTLEAQQGISTTKVMSPARVKDSIIENAVTKRWMTGEWVLTPDTVTPSGCIIPNGGTIGGAASGATTRANSDTADLFDFYWRLTNNVDYPIQDSTGAPTTRGASSGSDFAANKRIPIPNVLEGETLVASVTVPVLTKTNGEVLSHNHTTSVVDPGHSHSFYDVRNGGGGGYFGSGSVNWTRYTDPAATNISVNVNNSGGAKNKPAGIYTKVYVAL